MNEPILWRDATKYSVMSACGRYKVSRASVGGELRYQAWQTPANGQLAEYLGTATSEDAAKQIIEADRQRRIGNARQRQ